MGPLIFSGKLPSLPLLGFPPISVRPAGNKMTLIIAAIAYVLRLFHLCWAFVAQPFMPKEHIHVQVPDDLESGLSPSSMVDNGLGSEQNAVLIQKDVELPEKEIADQDSVPMVRRPSRPASTVHPVKSRIVEAAYKQVQDKTLNVVKTVFITPGPVLALPCSAMVEYYDPLPDVGIATLSDTRSKSARSTRSVQFVHKPSIINADTSYEVDSEQSFSRDSISFGDLLPLFPTPPNCGPSFPSGLPSRPTSQVRVLVESTTRRTSRAFNICPALILTQSSPYNSDAESTRSILSLSSDTQDSAELFLNGTPKFLSPDTAYFVDTSMDSHSPETWSEDDDVSRMLEEYAAEEAADAALRLAQAQILSSGHFAVVTSPSSTNLSALAETSKNSAFSESIMVLDAARGNEPKDSLETLDTLVAQDAQDTQDSQDSSSEFSVDVKASSESGESRDVTLCDNTPAFIPKTLVTPYRNVVDGATTAARHKGDIVDDRALRTKTATEAALAQADTILRELLRTSPSEDEIVDCLLAQLENSFECDEDNVGAAVDEEAQWAKRRQSLAWVEEQTTLTEEVKARLHNHLSLQGGRKSKSAVLAAAVEKQGKAVRSVRFSWELETQTALKVFREIETEDEDFSDMFYNDCSSFYSQSSLHRSLPDLKGDSRRSSRDKKTEDSFGTADTLLDAGDVLALFKSRKGEPVVVDGQAHLVLLPMVSEDPTIELDSLPRGHVAKLGPGSDETIGLAPSEPGVECNIDDGSKRCLTRCSWAATEASTDDSYRGAAGDDEQDDSEGEADQWSDILELDKYIAS